MKSTIPAFLVRAGRRVVLLKRIRGLDDAQWAFSTVAANRADAQACEGDGRCS
jgi:hypothetical protein